LSIKINPNYNKEDLHIHHGTLVKYFHVIDAILQQYGMKLSPFICKINECTEAVIRNTEQLCSRHRSHYITEQRRLKKKVIEKGISYDKKRPLENGCNPLCKKTRLNGSNNILQPHGAIQNGATCNNHSDEINCLSNETNNNNSPADDPYNSSSLFEIDLSNFFFS